MAITKTRAARELKKVMGELNRLGKLRQNKIFRLEKRAKILSEIVGIEDELRELIKLGPKDLPTTEIREPNPGVMSGAAHISIEDPESEQLRNFDAAKEGPLLRREIQLNLEQPSAFEEIYRQNASKACASCVGHCCRAFSLGPWVDDIPKSIKEEQKRLRKVMSEIRMLKRGQRKIFIRKNPSLKGIKSPELIRMLERQERSCHDEIYGMEFFSSRLRPIRHLDTYLKMNPLRDGEKLRTFRCTEFDEKAHRCKAHDVRPTVCRRYICSPATAGFAPAPEMMTFGQIEIARKNAKT